MADCPEKKTNEGMKDYTKRIASYLDKLPREQQKTYERWFWIGVVFIMLVIVFCAGFGIGFERRCVLVSQDVQEHCYEFMHDNNCIISDNDYNEFFNITLEPTDTRLVNSI
jgi:hypothetical protein